MKNLKDSSEIKEAARMLSALLKEKVPVKSPPVNDTASITPPPTQAPSVSKPSFPGAAGAGKERRIPKPAKHHVLPPVIQGDSRGEKLENILSLMCLRSGFAGAVIADRSGLPLAAYNSPVEEEAVAALTSVLGDALEKASRMLRKKGANNISMDISYEEKIVLRRFEVSGNFFFMMIICDQDIDVRSEMEISIDQVISTLR